MLLSGKHIVVGISGGIAAYKTPLLIRLLKKEGAEVKTVVTENALQFTTELTLQTVSNEKVYRDMFAQHNEHSTEHISLPEWADLLIVAPATANVIGKMANGIADDALSTTFLATLKPVLIAPAMNTNMYLHPATQKNLATLRSWEHISIIEAEEGELACGTVGKGRMAEPEDIAEEAIRLLYPKTLQGMRVLITAGPTQEQLDPVRYISNYSTGKMGYAIAKECQLRGAETTIVTGPVSPALAKQAKGCRILSVTSAHEMYEATTREFADADITILSAAVADFRAETVAQEKLKRKGDTLTLTLHPTEDIAAALGKQKTNGQQLIGFALETNNELQHAKDKLCRKNLDMIVLNSLNDQGAGFGYDTNKVTMLFHDGHMLTTPLKTKQEIATLIVDAIENHTL